LGKVDDQLHCRVSHLVVSVLKNELNEFFPYLLEYVSKI
jgi:hypothetical protein